MIPIPIRAITSTFAAALAPAAASFDVALRDPARAQTAALKRIASEVHRLRGVSSLRELHDFEIVGYDDMSTSIDRIANAGERTLLTRSPVIRFEHSGGSSGAHKLLPMTKAFLAEMNRALLPWLFSLYARTPGVADGCAYWSISPIAADRERTTRAGIPIGSDGDSAYFPSFARALIERVLAVPDSIAAMRDVDDARIETLRHLIARDDLTLISVWSPTFLTLLVDALDRNIDRLLADMPDRRRASKLRALSRRIEPRDLWPKLALVSMWTDAAAARFVDDAVARFPGVRVQPKGLLAVEGTVSIPYAHGDDPVLAVRSHVLEFVDDAGRARFVHELERGKTYEVLLTTSAGLVRYRLGDRIVVVGREHATPRVRFVGRTGIVADLVGEKLSATFAGTVLDRIVPHAKFAMLAPSTTPTPHYVLYLDATNARDTAHVAKAVDEALRAGHPYRYARDLGQLAAVEVVEVVDGYRAYEAACIGRGQRAGDIKPTPLHTALDWREAFARASRRG